MSEAFLISFREALQCSLIAALVFSTPPFRTGRIMQASFISGVVTAAAGGFLFGFLPSAEVISHEQWTFWRHLFALTVFFSSIVAMIAPVSLPHRGAAAALFLLGIEVFFFEARGAWFLIRDMGMMHKNMAATFLAGFGGMVIGFLPAVALRKPIAKVPFSRMLAVPGLIMVIGALQLVTGGVGELEKQTILVPLQQGIQHFLGESLRALQRMLLIEPHPFLDVPLTGLADYLAGDRTALSITILFVMAPPLFSLIVLFARPDPLVRGMQAGARRRQAIATFREEMGYRSTPALLVFAMLVILLHAANITLNPLYDPVPAPVRADETTGEIRIPLADQSGDLTDKKLRKYIYYHGAKQIIFLAILKADDTVGIALDECEICRPADWNVDAKGYAQRGEHLVCKYCMTPIATATVNSPGGCNPIPIPFRLSENTIAIQPADLIELFEKVQALEKKGTHL